MKTTKQFLLQRTWARDSYLISTDHSLIPIADLNAVFATKLVYWADPLPEDVMRETLENSLCFGLYDTKIQTNDNEETEGSQPKQCGRLIGFARCITDFTTFSYVTDVYILPSYQGEGLGKWIVQCAGEVHDSMPYLRRSMLFTSDWERSVPFYKSVLGMELCKGWGRKEGGGPVLMQKLGGGFPEGLR